MTVIQVAQLLLLQFCLKYLYLTPKNKILTNMTLIFVVYMAIFQRKLKIWMVARLDAVLAKRKKQDIELLKGEALVLLQLTA